MEEMTSLEHMERLAQLGITPYPPWRGLIYKYVPFEAALLIVKDSTLLFKSPTQFNDPFDLNNDLIDFTASPDQIYEWVMRVHPGTIDQKNKVIEDFSAEPIRYRDLMAEAILKSKNSMGISCFSRSQFKTLMWSHYANSHSGVCLGFRFYPISVEDEFFILNVSYKESIVPLNYFSDKYFAIMKWVYTKSHVWEYEEEVRAVYMKENGLVPFAKGCLEEIYYGVRASELHMQEMEKLLKSLNYPSVRKVARMQINKGTFDLREV